MFLEDGTYSDPVTGGPLTGPAVGQFAEELFAAYQDLEFEIRGNVESASGAVVLEWIMRGTNTGTLRGMPPTGARIGLPGVDLIRVRGDRIASLTGYFDRQTLLEQLGRQVVVQPYSVGPIRFGVSTRVQSNDAATPGALSLTMVDAQSDDEVQQIRNYSRRIMLDMPSIPGFLGFLGVVVARRLYTISAWTSPDHAHQLLQGGPHQEAAAEFLRGNLGIAFHSSVWQLHRMGPRWVRCPSCGRMTVAVGDRSCECGTTLPELAPFW
jgi:steroid delta-isomerase-like uncharacterized protein